MPYIINETKTKLFASAVVDITMLTFAVRRNPSKKYLTLSRLVSTAVELRLNTKLTLKNLEKTTAYVEAKACFNTRSRKIFTNMIEQMVIFINNYAVK